VYSCGSLWTSIIPCLALRGVATGIAQSPSLKVKALLLNAHNDRETAGYTAVDYVNALTNTLNRHDLTPRTSIGVTRPAYPTSAFVTHLVYLSDTTIQVDQEALTVRIFSKKETNIGFDDPLMCRRWGFSACEPARPKVINLMRAV